MSTQITTAFSAQYGSNVNLLAQQKGSRLRSAVRVETVVGEKAFFDQIGATTARLRTVRHADTPLIETPHSRRMVTMADYDWADLIDTLDTLKTLINPQSPYAINAANAFARAIDDAIIASAFATAYTGAAGGTSTSFPTATHQIAASSTGMTLAKLLATKEILDGYEVDEMDRYIVMTSDQVSDLLNTTEVKSTDYNTVKALAMGQINTFLGFTFIRSERVGVDTSSYRRCIAWQKNSLLLATGQEIKTRITERPDKNHATQVYANMSIGATRMDETGVVEILCEE